MIFIPPYQKLRKITISFVTLQPFSKDELLQTQPATLKLETNHK